MMTHDDQPWQQIRDDIAAGLVDAAANERARIVAIIQAELVAVRNAEHLTDPAQRAPYRLVATVLKRIIEEIGK